MKKILIAVITFRRPQQLQRLLEALARQKSESLQVSVLVVDNDPGESAAQTCSQAEHSLPIPVVYRHEPEPGIVAARNRCVSEFLATDAEGLAFIDDDEWPCENDWIGRMSAVAETCQADIVAGDVLSIADEGTPDWATRILYEPSRASDGEAMSVFYTGNVLIARRVLEALAPAFDQRFAMTGASDYHFALRCMRAGYRAVFAEAPVMEAFPPDRASVKWFLRRGYRSGAGFTVSHLIEDPLYLVVPKCLGLAVLRVGRGTLILLRGSVTGNRVGLVKGLFRAASGIGTVAGLFGLNYQEYQQRHNA
jgi:succinoglycan biosynthesis protein ExoM